MPKILLKPATCLCFVVQSTKLVALRYISLSLQLLGVVRHGSAHEGCFRLVSSSYQELEDISRRDQKKKEHVTSVARTASYG